MIKQTIRSDLDRKSIQTIRNILNLEGTTSVPEPINNDLYILWTPTTEDLHDTLTLPDNSRTGIEITIVNVGDYSGYVGDLPLLADYGSIKLLSTGSEWSAAIDLTALDTAIAFRPTYTEIVEGFTEGGGTTVPTVPTISLCKGLFRAIIVQWDTQNDLTNFSHYEVQVSADDSTWYSLEFDGTDWKDNEGSYTRWNSNVLVHTNIPLVGDVDDPSGKLLYYKVRRVTKDDDIIGVNPSAWSTSSSATTSTVQAGDLAQNSIYANNIVAGTLEAQFLTAGEVNIGFTGTDVTAPDAGDRKTFIDGDEIQVQEYLGDDGTYDEDNWSTVKGVKVGGRDSNGVFISGVSCSQVVNPQADEISQEFVPDPISIVYDYESGATANDVVDQDGKTPVSVSNCLRTRAWQKYGAYSLTATSGNHGQIIQSFDAPFGEAMCLATRINFTLLDSAYSALAEVRTTAKTTNNRYAIVATLAVAGDSTQVLIKFSEVNNSSGTSVYIQEVTLAVDITETELLLNDHFLAAVLSFQDNKLYGIVDGAVYSADINDLTITGTTDTAYGFMDVYNKATHQFYADDTLFLAGETANVGLMLQHYNHNVPWNTKYSAKDLVLRAADGGYVQIEGGFKVEDAEYDAAWIDASLLNSWVLYSAPYGVAHYRKDASGNVYVELMVKTGSAANAVMFTLPEGYRPGNQLIFPGYSAIGATRVDVKTDGSVLAATGGSTTWNSVELSFNVGGGYPTVGATGATGATGADGISINWLGSFASAPGSPDELDAYYNTADFTSYIYNGATWDILSKPGAAIYQ